MTTAIKMTEREQARADEILAMKPSELIEMAVADARKSIAQGHVPTGSTWVARRSDPVQPKLNKFCHFCLAGGVLLQEFDCSRHLDPKERTLRTVDTGMYTHPAFRTKIYALDFFRSGDIHGALRVIGIDPTFDQWRAIDAFQGNQENSIKNRSMYHYDIEEFFESMQKVIDFLKSIGL